MRIAPLPSGWDATRGTLQRYSHALTAFPRAGAPAHPRWNHVAMEPTGRGFVAAATPLADGTELVSELDLEAHRIVVTAGGDEVVMGLDEGMSQVAVAQAIQRLAGAHGSTFELDPDRVTSSDPESYDRSHAEAFLASSSAAVVAMRALNDSVDGETTGPHLWPHGFDIATEWFSERLVDYDGSSANAQIGMGWYPTEDGYLYVSPWPFDEALAEEPLTGGATWYRTGWEGAKWDITSAIDAADATALGRRVHELAGPALRSER